MTREEMYKRVLGQYGNGITLPCIRDIFDEWEASESALMEKLVLRQRVNPPIHLQTVTVCERCEERNVVGLHLQIELLEDEIEALTDEILELRNYG